MGRITINGTQAGFSCKKEVSLALWDVKTNRAKGKSEEARTLNQELDNIKAQITRHYQYICDHDSFVTAKKVYNRYVGFSEECHTLMNLFREQLEPYKKKIGIEKAESTYCGLVADYKSLLLFMKSRRHGLTGTDGFHTVHNYIDIKEKILRKGAIAAHKGEKILIPINMRDGSVLALGKGNPDWNFSAPHGAGRIMSRTAAKENLSMEDYKKSMENVYTTSVGEGTLDEAPMAYKRLEDILDVIQDSVDIIDIMKPIYNFKA